MRVTKYYTFAGQRIAMRSGDQVSYLHSDHLGSTSLLSDGSGNEIPGSRVSYFPYGETRIGDLAFLPTDFGFTGQRNEGTIGLYDYRARFYDPVLGRFVSADTLVPEPDNPQALNRYSYVYNRPLVYVDPSGHFGDEELLKYGVFYGPNQLGGCRDGEYGCAAWYWALLESEAGAETALETRPATVPESKPKTQSVKDQWWLGVPLKSQQGLKYGKQKTALAIVKLGMKARGTTHAVVVTGISPDGKEVRVNDPWDGQSHVYSWEQFSRSWGADFGKDKQGNDYPKNNFVVIRPS